MKKKSDKDNRLLPIIPSPISPELEAIFQAMEDGVCVQSIDSRILRANRAFAAMLDLPMEQIIGRTCAEVFGCCENNVTYHNAATFCAKARSNQSHLCESEELLGRRPGQRLRARVSPVHSQTGQITAYVMVVRDITDQIQREREIARAQQLALIGEMAAGLAHEIKNPLAGIQGAMDILLQRRTPDDPDYSVLNNVKHEVNRIDSSVHALLSRTRPRSIKREHRSLDEIVYHAVVVARDQMAFEAFRTKQITIEYRPPDRTIIANIDAPQLEDAILNLIINAIESIEDKGEIRVSLELAKNKKQMDEAVITVADNGSGTSEGKVKQIFSPFFTTKQNGTGLGLAAVRRIMRIHEGLVEVSSKIGSGSAFKLHLPLSEQH